MTEPSGGPNGAASGRPAGSWLTRNLKVLSGVSLLQDAASELLYPILPIFLTAVLGAPAAVVGAVEGVAEGTAALSKVASGRIADRFRARPMIGLGYGLAALGKVAIAAAVVWPVVLAGRSLDRLGKGIRDTPRDALIALGVPQPARGRAFGFHRAMDTTGAVIGPLIGLAGYELLHHRIRPLLVIAVVPAVASALLVAAVREAPRRVSPAGGWHLRRLPGRYWRIVAVLGLFGLVNFPDALLLLRLHQIGFSVPAVIGAYVTYNAVYALLSYPAGVVADRLSPPVVFGAGLILFALTYTGLGLTRSHTAAWLLLAAYGGFTALTDGVGKAWISGLLAPHDQGSGQGLFQGVTGLAVLAAGLWAGLAWGRDGTLPLLVSGAAAAALAAWLLTGPVRRGGSKQRPR
ncbi:Predicted arabinose efflux permease, MFS family [Micromonospora viridifaciens]|uniref:Predicted arabinose efflux permease, MFS family n=1 Tax=Micromonospora viridifaciens TaxID=1881 RepID=A0A1C4Y8T0_MICVI|nr:MFS transporter [Micromonospora viridifaciens]SCF17135.1 Predicted arabinose efflux permease, MFS family [Micromonospora viridifaciens]